jgi:hypothetical protein
VSALDCARTYWDLAPAEVGVLIGEVSVPLTATVATEWRPGWRHLVVRCSRLGIFGWYRIPVNRGARRAGVPSHSPKRDTGLANDTPRSGRGIWMREHPPLVVARAYRIRHPEAPCPTAPLPILPRFAPVP